MIDSLEAVARLTAASGRHGRAARLLSAAQALRDAPQLRYARLPTDRPAHDAVVAAVREALGDAEFEAAWAQGAAMSADEAVSYAQRGRGARDKATTGWDSLTRTEREVASLAQERLTTPEIAKRLFVSPRTIQTHLTHIFAKLGISSRGELATEAVPRHEPEPRGRT